MLEAVSRGLKASWVAGVLILLVLGCTVKKRTVTLRPPPPPAAEVTQEAPAPRMAEPKRTETVLAERLPVRSLPSADARIVGHLARDESVEVREQVRNWARIVRKDGTQGWVYGPGSLSGFREAPRSTETLEGPGHRRGQGRPGAFPPDGEKGAVDGSIPEASGLRGVEGVTD